MKSPFLFSLALPVIALFIAAGPNTGNKPVEKTATAVNREVKGGSTLEFTDANFKSKVLSSSKLTLVDFWAEWCGPCRAVGPVVEDLAKEYNGKVNIGKLNVDENPNTCQKYNITSIPTILFIKNGKVVDKLVGAHPKRQLVKKIEQHK
jgi:thioredoxin 1